MLYRRSSFLTWLRVTKDCDIIPLGDSTRSGAVKIKNGVCSCHLGTNSQDVIDYEEIWLACQKLMIVGLPGDSELIRVE